MRTLYHAIAKVTCILMIFSLLQACQKDSTDGHDCQMCHYSQLTSEGCFVASLNRHVIHFDLRPRSKETSQKHLEILASWLSNQRCISSAELLCNSCVYTEPPISEILVISKGPEHDSLIVDVRMSSPLAISGVHYNP